MPPLGLNQKQIKKKNKQKQGFACFLKSAEKYGTLRKKKVSLRKVQQRAKAFLT